MTDGLRLENVYGATIGRIKAQSWDKSRLGMGALMWVSYVEVPLSSDELCYALGIVGRSNISVAECYRELKPSWLQPNVS